MLPVAVGGVVEHEGQGGDDVKNNEAATAATNARLFPLTPTRARQQQQHGLSSAGRPLFGLVRGFRGKWEGDELILFSGKGEREVAWSKRLGGGHEKPPLCVCVCKSGGGTCGIDRKGHHFLCVCMCGSGGGICMVKDMSKD